MSRVAFVVAVCLLACVSAQVLQPVPQATTTPHQYTEEEHIFLFSAWKVQHQKRYAVDEEQKRFAIWKDNLKFVDEWNTQTGKHKCGMNHLADLTNAEYRTLYCGLRLPANQRFDFTAAAKNMAIPLSKAIPASVDWRTQGYVTAIKDQGQCGSCYSFSATGSMEGAVFKKTGILTSISEQQIVDCSGSFGNEGCNGGLMTNCFEYVIQGSKGEETEADYPYKAVQGPRCLFKAAKIASTISSYGNITSGDENDLATQCANNGPVSVAIDASNQSFQLYSSGVYNEPACSSTSLDHGVLLVGYGSDSGTDYYIVKNSWGTVWGQQGYIWMSRNNNNQCGIATMANYAIA